LLRAFVSRSESFACRVFILINCRWTNRHKRCIPWRCFWGADMNRNLFSGRLSRNFWLLMLLAQTALAQNVTSVRSNVNMVSGTALADGDPFLSKQNESTMAVSSLNPLNIMGGSNDYRLIPLAQFGIPGDAPADGWVSRYWSTDGGLTWRSSVVAGCPLPVPQCQGNAALGSPNYASDPTVRSGPYGSFFYTFIAGVRGTGAQGVVAVQRWFDMNNAVKAGDDPFKADQLNILDTGTSGQFLDKPWNIADISRSWNAGTKCKIPTAQTPVPAFNVYASWSNFVGQDPSNPHPQVFVARSTDCGFTFSKAKKVSQSVATNQGTVLTIDPQNGTVYLFWRQFFTAANNTPDAVYFVKSTDGGNTWSAPALVANNIPFFEQETGPGRFRAEAFPTAAVSVGVDGKSRVHVAWAQQWALNEFSGTLDGRIVITTSSDGGLTWTTPAPVDNDFQNQAAVPYAGGSTPISWLAFNPFNPTGRGQQYQPALTAIGSKLTMIWQDTRLDHTVGYLDCSSAVSPFSIQACPEKRAVRTGNKGTDLAANVFTPDITDATPGLTYRHTVDVFGGQATVGSNNNPIFTTTRISQYPFGIDRNTDTQTIKQLKVNPPNLPIFVKFTLPFEGDYNDAAGQTITATGTGYVWNTDPNTPVHVTWTTNQDVVTPKDGNWGNATPVKTLSSDSTSVVANPNCLPGQEGVQNQNVYTAKLFNGIDAYAIVNSKYLNSATPRQFNIVVKNGTGTPVVVSLAITGLPSGTSASFSMTSSLLSLSSLNIQAFSTLTRTVWVTSTNPAATVTVNVAPVGFSPLTVLLNPDPGATTATADRLTQDVVSNNQDDVSVITTLLANPQLTDPQLTDPQLTDPQLTDPQLTDPQLTDPQLTDPQLTDPQLTDISITNPQLTDPQLTDPQLTDPQLTDSSLGNSGIADATYTLVNNGTTDLKLDVKALFRGQKIPAGYNADIIIHKTYNTQSPNLSKRNDPNSGVGSCGYFKSPSNILVLNAHLSDSDLTSATDPTLGQTQDTNPNAFTLSLLPKEIGRVVFRLVKNNDPNAAGATEFGSNGVKVVVVNGAPTAIPVPVVIDTLSLDGATVGVPYPATSGQLQASGGTQPLSWSAIGGSFPSGAPGFNLSSTGLISGTATQSGLPHVAGYTFTAKVVDSTTDNPVTPFVEKQQTDKQTLTLMVFPGSTLVYGTPLPLDATSSSNVPIDYSVVSGPCSVSNNAITATAGSGTCTLTASQGGSAILLDPYTFTLNKANQAQLIVVATPNPVGFGSTSTLSTTGGSSNGAVTYSVGNSTGCSVSGNILSVTDISGSCSVTATMAGGGNYNDVTSAPLAVGLTKGNQMALTVIATPSPVTLGGMSTLSTAGGTTNGAVSYSVGNPPGCSLSGNILTVTNVNGCTVTATMAGNNNYNPVTSPPLVVGVSQAAQTIAFGALLDKVFGNPSFTVSATASSGLPVTFALTTPGTWNCTLGATSTTNGVSSATLTLTGMGSCSVTAHQGGNSSYAAAADVTQSFKIAGFVSTGSMGTARSYHTATLLGNGKVLVVGGFNANGQPLASAEVYDPAAGTFTATPNNMPNKAAGHAATLLTNGFVLVTGGGNSSSQLYNSATNTWSSNGGMGTQRTYHTATLLQNGKVLIAGGSSNSGATTNSAQIFDPATGNYTNTGNMTVSRDFHTAILLGNGKVLITGGRTSSGNSYKYALSTEIYDPATGTFTLGPPMSGPRYGHTAVMFKDSDGKQKVLISGGSDGKLALSTAELYDPTTGAILAVTPGFSIPRQYFTATVFKLQLRNLGIVVANASVDSVIATGGFNGTSQLANTDEYLAGSGFQLPSTISLIAPRAAHTATQLNNGKILITGGQSSGGTAIATAEVFGNQ
jgi:hypothetical protein